MSKKPYLIVLAIIIILGCGVFYFYYFRNKGASIPARLSEPATSSQPVFVAFSQLDGTGVRESKDQIPDVVGVMIENHPDARPQSGLSEAKVVYEAVAEGGITRFLALYDSKQNVPEVGPVRSARPYFIDWLREYGDGLYMHSGGSPQALSDIKRIGLFDANEFWWGSYYWRSNRKFAPHDLYTKSENWQKIINDYKSNRTKKLWEGWKYLKLDNLATSSFEKISEIKIPFAKDFYSQWKYNSQTGKYERYQDGKPHMDKDGSAIVSDNIIIQFTSYRVLDDEGRKEVKTTGQGSAYVLQNGARIKGTWKKSDFTSRTRFYDEQNNEMTLIPGQTWIEVVPNDAEIEVTN